MRPSWKSLPMEFGSSESRAEKDLELLAIVLAERQLESFCSSKSPIPTDHLLIPSFTLFQQADMADTFLFGIIEGVLSELSSLAVQEITASWNIKSDVRKLQKDLSTIKAVILDAEEQQPKNHAVRDWLQKLKDAVYDVDDLLDDLSMEASPMPAQISSGIFILKKVSRFFSSSNPIAHRFSICRRVKRLRMRLDEIAADRIKFNFTENALLINQAENSVREQTHSFVRASDIIGRHDDREFIVQLLLSSSTDEVSVIPIVGIGGLGKTTVVKLAYNDERVVQRFDLGMWVSVSEDFRLVKIVEKILKSATGESFGHLDLDQMQNELVDVLKGKRYLLVLDDIWNEDRNKWTDLKELLMNCRSGSKIVVTTRSKAVGIVTGTVSPYHLSGLSDESCLSLFLKCAFRGPDDWLPNLVEIAKEIVKKCGGVPLAVKTLGSLLYMNTDEQDWLRIKNNDMWEIDQRQSDILPLLRLSYENLPYYLRQCFAYCSMLPKGLEIPREVFINLWIAQGFIQSRNGNRSLEDIGNQYFNELFSRFCFQDVKEAFDGEILACKIHSLVHDLAQSVAEPEYVNMKFDPKNISGSVRHLFYQAEDISGKEFPKALLRLKSLRSFRYPFNIRPLTKNSIQAVMSNFRYLRMLIINSLELQELPNSIGELKRLKYLDLSQSRNLKCLPKYICNLVKLQTLNLINCENFQDLPRAFGKLIQIRTLYLTCQELSLRNIGRLQSLSSLQFLLLYNCDFVKLPSEGLKYLTSLRVLRIYDCQRLASLPNGIRYLNALEKLWIWNCEELDLCDGEGWQELKSLQSLLLMGLPKLTHLPLGLKENVAKTLKFLRIANCINFAALPEWIQSFTLLRRLYIEDCPNLSFLPEEAYSSIAQVHISGCPRIDEIC